MGSSGNAAAKAKVGKSDALGGSSSIVVAILISILRLTNFKDAL